MKQKRKIYLTDSFSVKVISPGVENAQLVYERITDQEQIKEFLIDNLDLIEPKIKRKGYTTGIEVLTGLEFNTAEDSIFDAALGDIVANFGIGNPTKNDIDSKENWEKGLFVPELRIYKIL